MTTKTSKASFVLIKDPQINFLQLSRKPIINQSTHQGASNWVVISTEVWSQRNSLISNWPWVNHLSSLYFKEITVVTSFPIKALGSSLIAHTSMAQRNSKHTLRSFQIHGKSAEQYIEQESPRFISCPKWLKQLNGTSHTTIGICCVMAFGSLNTLTPESSTTPPRVSCFCCPANWLVSTATGRKWPCKRAEGQSLLPELLFFWTNFTPPGVLIASPVQVCGFMNLSNAWVHKAGLRSKQASLLP